MSPNKDEEFDWDPSQNTVTAWAASHTRANKGRRAYGRRGSKKSTHAEEESRKRVVHRSRQLQRRNSMSLDELDRSNNSAERGSTSSNSAFDATRLENFGALLPSPAQPLEYRSMSCPVPSSQQRPPLLRPSRSVTSSVRSESTRDSSHSSLSSLTTNNDSRFEPSENVQPNIAMQDDQSLSSFLSPQPPTKLKKIDLTPLDIDLKGSAKRKKLIQRLSESDISDCSPSFMSPSNNSFSRLAKSAELAVAWIKPPDLSPGFKATIGFDFGCFADNTSSPAQSVATTGSRKRGVCELPFEEEDESSFNAGISFMTSSSSYETRSRSRSRISSAGSATKTAAAIDVPDPSELFTRAGTDSDSHNGKSDDEDSEAESEASDDLSLGRPMDFELEKKPASKDTKKASLLPPKPVRRSSNNFDDSVFGAKDNSGIEAPLNPSHIFDTMSHYDDLKFLIKALRKEKVGSTIASFGITKTWTIVAPPAWEPKRRTAFLQWASRGLGFSLRAGGGTVAFLQISVAKGGAILESLETALIVHKASAQNASTDQCKHQFRNKDIKSIVSSDSARQTCRYGGSSMAGAKSSSSVDEDIDMDLLVGMESLSLVADSKEPRASFGGFMAMESDTPLVRIVTMPTTSTSPHAEYTESPNESHRLSGEHHVRGHDLVLHLHGLSPTPGNGPPPLFMRRNPRASTRRDSSPFCQRLSAHYGAPRLSNITCIEDDGLETPLVKRENQFWGSGSRGGRDWGLSSECSDEIIFELLSRLETTFKLAGCPCSPFEIETSTPCFLPASVASAAVSSSALGFDDDSDKCDDSDIVETENEDTFDAMPTLNHRRQSSVGASALAELHLNDDSNDEAKLRRKRMRAFAKHRRVSLCAAVLPPVGSFPTRRQTTFVNHPSALSSRTGFSALSLMDTCRFPSKLSTANIEECPVDKVCEDANLLSRICSFLSEQELLCHASPVCTAWADAATVSHANLMLISVGCSTSAAGGEGYDSDDESQSANDNLILSVSKSMERSWKFLMERFPWACYLSDGAFKRVYKVFNANLNSSEAISVMDIDRLLGSSVDKAAVGAELAVASMLSSLARRNICPNFVISRGVFTCPYEPPDTHWGSSENKRPKGGSYDPSRPKRKPRVPGPKKRGKYQYIRMEFCSYGDAEEHLKRLPNEVMPPDEARVTLFQIAFGLHVAADRYSLKHYDIKLLNIFLQNAIPGRTSASNNDVVLRYGLGAHVFALRMPAQRALIAKVADYGTANVQAASNGQPVTIGQFTTLENTPPDYLLLGDAAIQGHGHDCFGLGLCMLHLYTGHKPYEEILEDVQCPPALKKKLRQIWQEDEYAGYNVVRQIIMADVDEGENEGEPDETLYHTLYRYLVLFGIPEDRSQFKEYPKVSKAITQSLEGSGPPRTYGRNAAYRKEGPDSAQFASDRRKYSLSHGNNIYIARARKSLQMMEGGMELLMSLVHFDPLKRATPLDVLNSLFMTSLRETPGQAVSGENVLSFMSYAAR